MTLIIDIKINEGEINGTAYGNPAQLMVELERLLEHNYIDYKAEGYTWWSGYCENIIFWCGFKREIPIAIKELQAEGKIRIDIAQPIVYMTDGKMLNLPLVKSNRNYKTPHWLPIVLNTGREPDEIMKTLHIMSRTDRLNWKGNNTYEFK